MFKKGQLVRNKVSGDLFMVLESELMWFGFIEVESVRGFGKGSLRKCDLELISNNFKSKWCSDGGINLCDQSL